jgi:hypothetical protein
MDPNESNESNSGPMCDVPAIPEAQDVIGYVSADRITSSYDIVPNSSGNLIVSASGLDVAFQGFLNLLDSHGNVVAFGKSSGTSLRAAISNAVAGEHYTAQLSGYGDHPSSTTIRWEQPTSLPPDPADNTPPTRIFHDAAGGAFADARYVAVDKSNKGDDAGQISPTDDVDFYRFTANATGKVEIKIAPHDGLTTFVTLYDGQKNAVDTSASDNDEGYSTFLHDVVVGGTYYIGISSKDHSSTGGYELHIRPFDPNTAPGQSGTDTTPLPLTDWGSRVQGPRITLNNGNGSSSGFISDPGETDWFEIDGAHAGNMVVNVAGVNDDLKEFVTAFRSNGGGIDSDNGEFDGTAQVGFTVAAGERIYVAVASHEGKYTGGYTITVSQPSTLPDDDYPDLGETPRDMNAEITAEGNGFLLGRIETPSDNDWFKIPVRGNGYLTVEVVPSDGSDAIPFLELSRDGTTGGFFESDDGRDGRAHIAFIPSTSYVWAKVSSLDGTQGAYTLNVWRNQNPDDDHPDSGGAYAAPLKLAEHGSLTVTGRIEYPSDKDCFRVLLNQAGPVVVEIVSLTEGFVPFLHDSWQTPDHQGNQNTDGGSGRGGRTFHVIPNIMPSPDNWVNIDISGSGAQPYGDYVLYVWQPQNAADTDVNTIGLEASPILLDGTGSGSLPGSPNGSDPAPSLDYAGDKDVFQVTALANRPITFSSNANTFLRVYDASGQSIATDHGSGPGSTSQITLEANRGQLFYLEVSAYNGTDTGAYAVHVSQPTDDHPDAPIFALKKSQTRDASVISLDASGFGQATGQIEATLVGDRDVFQVLAAQRGQMTVSVATTDNQLDTFIRVYDSHGTLVGIDDDGGDIRNSTVTFPTFQTETYQIEVSGYNDNSVGAYQVTVSGNVAISDPVLFTVPSKTTTTTGVYDAFTDNSLDATKWSTDQGGQATIAETAGQLRLTATGPGAPSDDNHATVQSLGIVQGDVEFDLTPTLGHDNNSAFSEVTDGTNYIRVALDSDAAGGILLGVRSNGYTELENVGFQAVTAGTTCHISLTQTSDGISVYRDGTRVARYAGTLRINSELRSGVTSAASPSHYQLSLYDDFSDNSIDGTKWRVTQDSGGQGVSETGGRLVLYGTAGGSPRTQNVYSTASTGVGIRGASWTQAYLDSGMEGMNHYAEISNGTDYIRIFCESNWQSFIIQLGGSYGSGSVKNVSGLSHTIDIKEVGSDIQILLDGSVQYTIVGKSITANSYFHAFANSTNSGGGDHRMAIDNVSFYHVATVTGQDRSAELLLDNVQGTFQITTDSVRQAYDTFDDNQVDYSKWHVTGAVNEQDGSLKLSLYRSGNAVSGYVSTAGIPGGMNLRGFRLGASRTTEPKRIGATDGHNFDTWARMRLTNGNDWIQVGWNLQHNTFQVETHGAYGERSQEFAVPVGQIVDGSFEVRETNGNIEVLHDGVVQLLVAGQTVRAGSFFTFESNGNPPNGGTPYDAPANFDVIIDNLWFYVDPVQPDLNLAPALKQASDSGASNTDHVTNTLSPDFEWIRASSSTMYQWRSGEMQTDGSVAYGVWSAVQGATTAHLTVDHGGTYVFSVRPIDVLGITGEPEARAFVVDTSAPTVTLTIPALTNGAATVTATDIGSGVPDGTTVFMDVELDGNGTFEANELGVATAPLINGTATFTTNSYTSQIAYGTYTLRARLSDAAGNEGASDVATVTIDTTPPTVTLDAPFAWNSTLTATVTAVDTGSGVSDGTTVSLDVDLNDNGDFTDPGETGFATATLSGGTATVTCLLPGGYYQFQARVSDVAGNEGISDVAEISLGVSPPWVRLRVPAFTNSSMPIVTVTATDGDPGVSEGAPVFLDVDLNNDGDFTDPGETGNATATLISGTATFTLSLPLGEGGTYRVQARVRDAAGNEAFSDIATVTVDTIAPTVTIAPASFMTSPTSNSTVYFAVTFSEPVSDFSAASITLGGTAGATTATLVAGGGDNCIVAVSGMTQTGNVTASIDLGKIHDRAGNGNAESASATVVYDTTLPNTSVGVSGVVWNDQNGDGIRTTGEPGVGGAVVQIYLATHETAGNADDILLGTAVTDVHGRYSFSNLPEEVNYYEIFRTPVSYTFTTQNADDDTTVDSEPDATGVTALFAVPAGQTDATRDAGLVGAAPGFGFAFSVPNATTRFTAADALGNVYVVGSFSDTVDFDPGPGTFNLASLASDSTSLFVAKYSSAGALIWVKSVDVYASGIALGSDGCIYTTGTYSGTVDFDPGPGTSNLVSSGSDAFVWKLDSNGNFVWAKSTTGEPTNGSYYYHASPKGIAVGADGSLCIGGNFSGTIDFDPSPDTFNLTSTGDQSVFVLKLDSAGDFDWARSAGTANSGGSSPSYIYANAIAVAADGSVYSTGFFSGTAVFDPTEGGSGPVSSTYDAYIWKLDSNGNFVWAKSTTRDSTSGSNDGALPNEIAVGSDGSLYVAGIFRGTTDFDPSLDTFTLTSVAISEYQDLSAFILKLDSAGDFVWAKGINGVSTNYGDQGIYGIAVGADGDVYTTGVFDGTVDFDPGPGTFNLASTGYAAFVLDLTSTGDLAWVKSFGGTEDAAGQSSGDCYAGALVVGSDGNIYTSGSFSGTVDFDPGPGTFDLTSDMYSGSGFVLKLDNTPPVVTMDCVATNSHSPALSGTVDDPLAVIQVTVAGNTYIGVNNADGTWTLPANLISPALAEGVYNVAVTATDSSGNVGADATTNELQIDVTPPSILSWASAGDHGHGVGEALLTISDDGTFSEPRDSGINRLLVTFGEAIDPTTFVPASIRLVGNDASSTPIDLSGVTITTSTRNGNTVGVIQFASALPDYARYLVRIDGVTDVAGNPLAGDSDVILTALKGDVTGDGRVNATDLSRVRGYTTDPISAANVNQVRADLSVDGRVNATDLSRVRAYEGRDARGIADPVVPSTSGTMLAMAAIPPSQIVPTADTSSVLPSSMPQDSTPADDTVSQPSPSHSQSSSAQLSLPTSAANESSTGTSVASPIVTTAETMQETQVLLASSVQVESSSGSAIPDVPVAAFPLQPTIQSDIALVSPVTAVASIPVAATVATPNDNGADPTKDESDATEAVTIVVIPPSHAALTPSLAFASPAVTNMPQPTAPILLGPTACMPVTTNKAAIVPASKPVPQTSSGSVKSVVYVAATPLLATRKPTMATTLGALALDIIDRSRQAAADGLLGQPTQQSRTILVVQTIDQPTTVSKQQYSPPYNIAQKKVMDDIFGRTLPLIMRNAPVKSNDDAFLTSAFGLDDSIVDLLAKAHANRVLAR